MARLRKMTQFTFFLLLLICCWQFVCASAAFECNILGTDVNEPEGYVESPPPASVNKNCIWLFEVPEGKFLKLNFTKFELHRQQLCINSFVEFTSLEGHEIRFCADQRPPLLTFAGPQEVMFYTRIGRWPVAGFRAQFWTEDKFESCMKGYSLCKNGKCFPNGQKCDGLDQCGDATDEENCGHKRSEPAACGRPVIRPVSGNEYIAGGKEAQPGSWPWQVSLQMKDVFPSGHFCGATLIDNFWLLTAAHCFETRNASMVRARFGSYDTFVHGTGEYVRYIEKVISHPHYDEVSIENDIALLKLTAPAPFGNTVSPVCLPHNKKTPEAHKMLYATGWGEGKYNEKMEVLRQAMMPILDWKMCNKTYYGEISKNAICTHYEMGGHSPCMGDSGGPLVMEEGDTWTQYGVVSWGHEDCAHRFWPSVYTNVVAFLPWIQSVVTTQ